MRGHPDASGTSPKRQGAAAPSPQLVKAAFAIVAVGVIGVAGSALVQVQTLQENAQGIVQNMLTSVQLVGQLGLLMERRRALIGDHIFASTPAERAELDAELADVRGEIAATSRAYEPWAVLPNERNTWVHTRADLAALSAPIAHVLALSRQNRDEEARRQMRLLREPFLLVRQDLDKLITINDRATKQALWRFSMTRRRLMRTLVGIGLAALLATVLVGRWLLLQISRREAQARQEQQSLEARNQELDAFAGRVAHDLRGPLTSLTLAAGQLAPRTDQDVRPLGLLQRSLNRMKALVDDLLALSRLEMQERDRCDPAEVVALVKEELGARLTGEDATLQIAVAHAAIGASEGLLRQAVINLVENAIKYRRADAVPAIEIRGELADDAYCLRISDNGMGMSPEDAARVFEPFFRSSRTCDRPGTGLGLSIVDRITRATGGTISVQTTPGKGSTFVLRFPLADRRPPAPRDRPAAAPQSPAEPT